MNNDAYSRTSAPRPRRRNPARDTGEFHLGEWLDDIWEGRYLILFFLVLSSAVGALMAWRMSPVYEAEALLQLHAKEAPSNTDPVFAKMEGLFSRPSDALTEVEILKSDLVLGRTVKALGLDISAEPQFTPVIGEILARRSGEMPQIEVQAFQLPGSLAGKDFSVTIMPDGAFRLRSPSGETLGTGKPGTLVAGVVEGSPVLLKLRAVSGKPGQEFLLSRLPLATAIERMRDSFGATQRGTQTNVIGLSYRDSQPARAEAVLEAVINQYLAYTLERKKGDADKTRELLEAKLGPLKAKLDASESRLNQFRSSHGAVDLSREAETLLLQSSNIKNQISALAQKREETRRTYRDNSDVVTTLNQQIRMLESEAAQIDSRVRDLPGTQQEVVRLSRDVQINTELYTALLNNLQQLQIASSGNVGAVAAVGAPAVNPEPVGPKPMAVQAFFSLFGALLGVGITMLRQLLRMGIRDHRIIETKLGIPVLATIPHSRDQERHANAMGKNKDGVHVLAHQHPDDLAIESLRSLRTTLLFAMRDEPNHTIMVTSPSPSVGKSFLCANLGILLAQTGVRVLLVDADLRRGNQHLYFGLKTRQGGLSDALSGRMDWQSAVHGTEFPGLHIISTGLIPADPSQLLLSKRFTTILQEVRAAYDYVIFDVPPLLPVTDAAIIGASVGTVLLMARYGQHTLDELLTCQKRLEDNHIRLNGCIFNDLMPTGLGYGYQEYRYAYHYRYK